MEASFEKKILAIKDWLGTGSINIFGLPMSGKDTVGMRLARAVDGKFLSSGRIIRAMETANNQHLTAGGDLIDTNVFYDWVLPYFEREDLKNFPLVLSSIGRWAGEEDKVIETAKRSGHPIKAVIILNVSEADVANRWQTVNEMGPEVNRENRADDKSYDVFEKRIQEFIHKTMPVVLHYRQLGLLIEVNADMDRDQVFVELIEKLFAFVEKQGEVSPSLT